MSFFKGSLAGSVVSLLCVGWRVFSPGVTEDGGVYPGAWLWLSPELLRPVCMKAKGIGWRHREVEQHESMGAAPCML